MIHTNTSLRLPRLLHTQTLSCIDGRKDGCTLGVPGGNMGVFLMMLSALSEFESSPRRALVLDAQAIQSYLRDYVLTFGSFLMHTDEHALAHVLSHMEGKDDEHDELLNAPPEHLHDMLLDVLTCSEAIGCGHIKLMCDNPARYELSSVLIDGAIRAFFELSWRGPAHLRSLLEYPVLRGHHQEHELIHYTLETPELLHAEVSICMDCHTDGSAFAFHEPALHYMLDHSVSHAGSWFELVPHELDALKTLVYERAHLHMEMTRRELLPDLPVRSVVCPTRSEVD